VTSCACDLVVHVASFATPPRNTRHSLRRITPRTPLMAPYDFEAPDADIILRSSDGKEFRVHRLILSLASPFFQDMFNLPQPTAEPPSQIPSVDVPEPSDILQPFIQYLYPRSPPKAPDIAMWVALYTIADKYNVEVVMELLRNMLIPWFLDTSPLRVYALACHWGFKEEAKTAARRTLTMDISGGFPEEDATLMGGLACQKLYLLHIQRQERARTLLNKRTRLLPDSRGCACSTVVFHALIQALSQRVPTAPWLTAEELYKEAAKTSIPKKCSVNCCVAFEDARGWISSILEEVSKLPKTI